MSTLGVNHEGQGNCIMVMYRLPILARRKADGFGWDFQFDNDALYLTFEGLQESLVEKKKVTWIGILNLDEDIDEDEQYDIGIQLWEGFRCVPVWIKKATVQMFYTQYCKGILWPLLHMVNYVPERISKNDYDVLWGKYMYVNRLFKEAVVARTDEGIDLIWIHDYHLMVLPSMLRSVLTTTRIGYFLHTPWPSSEIYRNLPKGEVLLKGILGSSLVGFHLFDFARHFLSSCTRILDLEHKLTRGYLTMDHFSRTITIRVSHIGAHPARFRRSLENPDLDAIYAGMVKDLDAENKFVFGAIDDLDVIKGIPLKLRAFEMLLAEYPQYRSRVKLIQYAIPRPHTFTREIGAEIESKVAEINGRYADEGIKPVEYFNKHISFDERLALYRMTDVLVLLPIREGLNLHPYEYIMASEGLKPGRMILSETTGCSRALSLTMRVNAFDKRAVVDRMRDCIQIWESCEAGGDDDLEVREVNLRQSANNQYVLEHSTKDWADSFIEDVEKITESTKMIPKLGLGEGAQHIHDSNLLRTDLLRDAYQSSQNRLFLMDYDGTLQATGADERLEVWTRPPSDEVQEMLKDLSSRPRNKVYILSGRTRSQMETMFESLENVGLAAEHGFYYKPAGSAEWRNQMEHPDSSWKETVREILSDCTERVDGSYMEEKDSALVWHYKKADPEFGRVQAKEVHENLETILSGLNLQILSGYGWVQVRLAGVSKRNMVMKILEEYEPDALPDFIFCAGDDVTDEDMFIEVSSYKGATVFTCVVGMKPTNADYYLRNSHEVVSLLSKIRPRQRLASSDLGNFNMGNFVPLQANLNRTFNR